MLHQCTTFNSIIIVDTVVKPELKRAVELREQGRRRRGWSRLIWEECVNRDVKKTDIGVNTTAFGRKLALFQRHPAFPLFT